MHQAKATRPDKRERRRLITVYGRNAVLEALQEPTLECRLLHLADSNRENRSLGQIIDLATKRGVDVRWHSREALARISRNKRQDQGVALDVRGALISEVGDFIDTLTPTSAAHLLAFDGVTNPQNMGMAIRSATAAGINGMLYADRGNPALGPLVIKASAGTVFRAPLLRCESVASAVRELLQAGFTLYRLQASSAVSLYEHRRYTRRSIFVLGGESDGISPEVSQLPGENIAIPMANGVESLNVAVSAALLCYQLMHTHR